MFSLIQSHLVSSLYFFFPSWLS